MSFKHLAVVIGAFFCTWSVGSIFASTTPVIFEHKLQSIVATDERMAGAAFVLRENRAIAIGGTAQPRVLMASDISGAPQWEKLDVILPEDFREPLICASPDEIVIIDQSSGNVAQLSGSDRDGYRVSRLVSLPGNGRILAATLDRGECFAIVGTKTPQDDKLLRLLHLSTTKGVKWTELTALDERFLSVKAIALQSDGIRKRLFFLGDGLSAYDIEKGQVWTLSAPPASLSNPQVFPVGNAHLYALAGGAVNQLLIYNTVTRRWLPFYSWPAEGRVVAFRSVGAEFTTLALADDGRATLLRSAYTVRVRELHALDYVVMTAFVGLLVLFALINRKRYKSADSYFRGGKKIPWLAAGLSVVATGQSATSFVSIPARSFATNWQFSLVPLTNVFGAFIMSRYFVKFFVRLNITSGYEYLQVRFSSLVRTIGSLNYLTYEIARTSLLILVPAVAVAGVTKIDLATAICAMGLVATIYTSLGGLEGVVWADVIQIILKIGAILTALILVFVRLEGNMGELAASAWQMGKLKMVDWSFDLTRDTFWAFLLFWMTDGLKSYVANQTIIQRYVSTRDEKAAQRSIYTSAFVGTLISWAFLLLGTGMFLFYHQNPERFDLTVDKPDAVFPWFIVFELPPGLVGLLITALIAAAFSSLYGALNSTSTVIVTDFYRRFAHAPTDTGALRLGKVCTVVIGGTSTAISLTLASLASKSLVEQTLSVIGLFGGGLGGLFLLGMLTTRASARSALVGFLVSAGVQYYVSRHTSLHWLTYMFTGMGSCFLAGWLGGFVWPERRKLGGLTVHTYELGKKSN